VGNRVFCFDGKGLFGVINLFCFVNSLTKTCGNRNQVNIGRACLVRNESINKTCEPA
jgi:hypothetical protein